MGVERSYSGRFIVRIPPYLHEKLVKAADDQGVSLNTLVQTSLAELVTRLAADRRAKRLEIKREVKE